MTNALERPIAAAIQPAILRPGALSAAGAARPVEFIDDFNRPAEQLSASPDWTLVSGAATACVVNAVGSLNTVETLSAGAVYLSPDLGSADHFIEARLVGTGAAGPFLCCRLTDASNFVGVRDVAAPTSQYQLYDRIEGTFTLLGSYNETPAPGDLVRIEVQGPAVRVLINGVQRIAATTALTGAALTRQGLYSRLVNKSPWIDDYRAGVLE